MMKCSLAGLGAALLCSTTLATAQGAGALERYVFKTPERVETLPDRAFVLLEDPDDADRVRRGLVAAGAARAEAWPLPGWLDVRADPGAGAGGARALLDAAAAIEGVRFVSPALRGLRGGVAAVTPDVFVGFVGGADPAAIDAALRAAMGPGDVVLDRDFMPGVVRLRLASRAAASTLAWANAMAQRADVAFAEPDYMFTGGPGYTPDDPMYLDGRLWGLHNTGQSGGVADVDMDAPEAWDTTTGDPAVIAVVFDTGVDQHHADLNQRPGMDFTTTPGVNGGPVFPYEAHGTAVAGCISATIDNALGVVGIAPACRTASARTFVGNPDGTWSAQGSWTADALLWGQSIGARVSNNSNYYGFTSSLIETAYAQTRAAGMVHFGSAGNDASQGSSYPASLPTVNAVSAIDRTGALAGFSNFGPDIAFSGPGVSVWTTDVTGDDGYGGGDHAQVDGTSFASPYAAGVAAIVISRFPSLDTDLVEELMRQTAKDFGAPGFDHVFGFGFVSAGRALAGGADCNDNGQPDVQDIAESVSEDENGNFVPDECDCATADRGELAAGILTGGGVTDENGAQVSLSVTLTTDGPPPGSDVFVFVQSLDETEGTVSTPMLVFSTADWDQAQQVTVTGRNDGAIDGDRPYTVRFTVDSDDLCWTFTGADVMLTNLDNDRAGYEAARVEAPAGVAAEGDEFGRALAVHGDTLVVGAFAADPLGSQSGAAHAFRNDAGAWTHEATLTPLTGATGARFGASVAVDGNAALVGASGDSSGAFLGGAAYLFRRVQAGWEQEARLLSDDVQSADRLGAGVALEGDLAVVGADREDEAANSAGAAYVFRRVGGLWTQEAKLVPESLAGSDLFGASCALRGGLLVVGAPGQGHMGSGAGAVYVFEHDGAAWVETAHLRADDTVGGDNFGAAVAIGEGVLLVGAPGAGPGGVRVGAAYVFRHSGGGGGGGWTQEARLTTTDAAIANEFGASVALDGPVALVGAHTDVESFAGAGSATAFVLDGQGAWREQLKLMPSDPHDNDQFGAAVAMAGGVAVAGSPLRDGPPANTGAAYIFAAMTDCNANGVLDAIDIEDGASADADGNGVPDECETAPCPADLTGDGSVDGADLATLLGLWGSKGGAADLTDDGAVDGADLATLLGLWGDCP